MTTVYVTAGQTYTHSTSEAANVDAISATLNLIHGDIQLNSEGGNIINGGDGALGINAQGTSAGTPTPADTITGGAGEIQMDMERKTGFVTAGSGGTEIALFTAVLNFTNNIGSFLNIEGNNSTLNISGDTTLLMQTTAYSSYGNQSAYDYDVVNGSGSDTITGSAIGSTYYLSGSSALTSLGNDTVVATAACSLYVNTGAHVTNELVVLTSGNGTISGGNATVFGGSGTLDYAGGAGTLVLGSGQSTIGGGAAGTQEVVFAGSGSVVYNGSAEKSYVISGVASVTVSAGLGGGWAEGGSNGNNSLTATGVGTVLEAGGNGDTLTGASAGYTYFLASAGNETLVGGNSSGNSFFFGGTGVDTLDLGGGTSTIDVGTGAEVINSGMDGVANVFLTASSGTMLIDGNSSGGDMTVSGFRLGTDHIHTGAVTAESYAGGTTNYTLSGDETVHLVGINAIGKAVFV